MENEKIFNPFKGRDRVEVWKELRKNAQHITKEQFFQHIQELMNKKEKREREGKQED